MITFCYPGVSLFPRKPYPKKKFRKRVRKPLFLPWLNDNTISIREKRTSAMSDRDGLAQHRMGYSFSFMSCDPTGIKKASQRHLTPLFQHPSPLPPSQLLLLAPLIYISRSSRVHYASPSQRSGAVFKSPTLLQHLL